MDIATTRTGNTIIKSSEKRTANPTRETRKITPAQAKEMLKLNVRNRPLKRSVLLRYAESMRRDQWKHSPEPISFDWNNHLIDGRHRLEAIVLSGTTQVFDVSYGWDPDTFDVIGKGAPRGTDADLALLGYKNANHLQAVARRMTSYVRAGYLNRSIVGTGSNGTVGAGLWVSPQEILDFVDAYPPLTDSVQHALPLYQHRGMARPASISFAYALFSPFFAGTLPFLQRAITGLNLKEGDPAAHLHRRLITNLSAPKAEKLDAATVFAYFVIALNRDAEGREMKRLALPKNEMYPQPVIQPAVEIAKVVGWPEPRGESE